MENLITTTTTRTTFVAIGDPFPGPKREVNGEFRMLRYVHIYAYVYISYLAKIFADRFQFPGLFSIL